MGVIIIISSLLWEWFSVSATSKGQNLRKGSILASMWEGSVNIGPFCPQHRLLCTGDPHSPHTASGPFRLCLPQRHVAPAATHCWPGDQHIIALKKYPLNLIQSSCCFLVISVKPSPSPLTAHTHLCSQWAARSHVRERPTWAVVLWCPHIRDLKSDGRPL